LTPRQSEILVAFQRNRSLKATARELEIEPKTVRTALDAIGWDTERRAEYVRDPAIAEAMAAVGTKLQPALAWAKTAKGEDGTSYSVLLKPAPEAPEDIAERIAERMAQIVPIPAIQRPQNPASDKLNFIPVFDVHLGLRVGNFGTAEAVERLKAGFQYVMSSAPMAETTIIVNGGDFTKQAPPGRRYGF
jgi:hypothetical protein